MKGGAMNKKSFTLIEILVVLIIVSILASVSVALYQKTVESNNERICAENLKVLQSAIDIYTIENDALPAGIAQLTPRHIYLASSLTIKERKENLLSIALRKMFSTEPALATPPLDAPGFMRRHLGNKKKVLCDPADKNCNESCISSTPTCASYNSNLDANNTDIFNTTTKRLNTDGMSFIVYDKNPKHKKVSSTAYPLGVTPGGIIFRDLNGNTRGDYDFPGEACDYTSTTTNTTGGS